MLSNTEQVSAAEAKYCANSSTSGKNVVIIGGGPSGIISTKYLKPDADGSSSTNILCIEGKSNIGGLWKFDGVTESNHDSLDKDAFYNAYGVLQSSLYEDLIVNSNKAGMCFKGLPPRREFEEYMKAEQFQTYLEDFVQLHNLREYMVFDTFVSSVRLSKNLIESDISTLPFTPSKKFIVELVSSKDYRQSKRYLEADFIVIGTGHFSVPNLPIIAQSNTFEGTIIHTHYYRKSKVAEYAGKNLLIYGASISAQDIMMILLKNQVDVLKPKTITLVGNADLIQAQERSTCYVDEIATGTLILKAGIIESFNSKNSVRLNTNEVITNIDHVLYATGYQFSYPFLEKNTEEDHVIEFYNNRKSSFGPLYKRMISVNEPNIIFIGVVQTAFQLQACLERQAIIARQLILGNISLPEKTAMLESFKKDYEEASKRHSDGRYYLKVSLDKDGFNDFRFNEQLQELAQVPFDEEFEQLYKDKIYPIHYDIAINGNYPLLKVLKFNRMIDEDYAPKEGFF